MTDVTTILLLIAGAVFAISIYFQCCSCIRDQRLILRLTAPIFPEIQIHENNNTVPIANGIQVDSITEDLEIIIAD